MTIRSGNFLANSNTCLKLFRASFRLVPSRLDIIHQKSIFVSQNSTHLLSHVHQINQYCNINLLNLVILVSRCLRADWFTSLSKLRKRKTKINFIRQAQTPSIRWFSFHLQLPLRLASRVMVYFAFQFSKSADTLTCIRGPGITCS